MKNRSVVVTVGLALLVAESAAAAVQLPGPPVPVPELPAVPTVPPLPSVPVVPQLPGTPQIPSVPDVPQLPRLPGLPAPSGGSQVGGAPNAPQGHSGGGSSGSVSGARGSSGSPAGRAGETGGGAGGGTTGTSARGRSGGSASGGRVVAAPSPRHERRLRVTVRRLEGCLDGLRPRERRVLVLRAGLGERPARSRTLVADALDLSPRRVMQLERRGVRRLRAVAREGRCGGGEIAIGDAGAPAGGVSAAAGLLGVAAGGLPTGPLGVLVARGLSGPRGEAAPPPDRVEVKGEQESSGAAPPELAPHDADEEPVRPPPPAAVVKTGGDGADLTLPLLLVTALGALVLAVRAIRRTVKAEPPA